MLISLYVRDLNCGQKLQQMHYYKYYGLAIRGLQEHYPDFDAEDFDRKCGKSFSELENGKAFDSRPSPTQTDEIYRRSVGRWVTAARRTAERGFVRPTVGQYRHEDISLNALKLPTMHKLRLHIDETLQQLVSATYTLSVRTVPCLPRANARRVALAAQEHRPKEGQGHGADECIQAGKPAN